MQKPSYLILSKSILLKFNESGKLSVMGSVSRKPFPIGLEILKMLSYFARPTTIDDAYELILKDHEISPAVFKSSIEMLIKQNAIVSCDSSGKVQDSSGLAKSGFALLEVHHTMLRDYPRVMAYRSAIMANARDKEVVEIVA